MSHGAGPSKYCNSEQLVANMFGMHHIELLLSACVLYCTAADILVPGYLLICLLACTTGSICCLAAIEVILQKSCTRFIRLHSIDCAQYTTVAIVCLHSAGNLLCLEPSVLGTFGWLTFRKADMVLCNAIRFGA